MIEMAPSSASAPALRTAVRRRSPWLIVAGLHGAVAVVMGAYAAHGMSAAWSGRAVAWVETGSRYELIHAAALVAVALLAERMAGQAVPAAGWGLGLGAALFSGALYGLAFTGQGYFGAIAPFGGMAMILGWLALAIAGALGRRPGGGA